MAALYRVPPGICQALLESRAGRDETVGCN